MLLNYYEIIQIKLIWSIISRNLNAIELLKKNPDKINWDELSSNIAAINLLQNNPNKINWNGIYFNSNAIELLLVINKSFNFHL